MSRRSSVTLLRCRHQPANRGIIRPAFFGPINYLYRMVSVSKKNYTVHIFYFTSPLSISAPHPILLHIGVTASNRVVHTSITPLYITGTVRQSCNTHNCVSRSITAHPGGKRETFPPKTTEQKRQYCNTRGPECCINIEGGERNIYINSVQDRQ